MSAPPSADRVRVLDRDDGPELPIVAGSGRATAIVWPGMGAELRSMARIVLDPGAGTVELVHPGEAVYYVASGDGEVVDRSSGEVRPLVEGSMAHVEPGTAYRLSAGPGGMELIGGPSPPDPAMYAHLGEAGGER